MTFLEKITIILFPLTILNIFQFYFAWTDTTDTCTKTDADIIDDELDKLYNETFQLLYNNENFKKTIYFIFPNLNHHLISEYEFRISFLNFIADLL